MFVLFFFVGLFILITAPINYLFNRISNFLQFKEDNINETKFLEKVTIIVMFIGTLFILLSFL